MPHPRLSTKAEQDRIAELERQLAEVITPEQEAIADEADWQAMVDEKEKERRIANRKADR